MLDQKMIQEVGLHVGQSRTRRHPSMKEYVYESKSNADIFNTEKTLPLLEAALAEVARVAQAGKALLMIGGKNEVIRIVEQAGTSAGVPFVAGRWIGGALTNFKQIRSRVERLQTLRSERDTGSRTERYTKKECVLFDREIDTLEFKFSGIESMDVLPGAVFVVDSNAESIPVAEARQMKIPTIALVGSDCDAKGIKFPIVGNDSNTKPVSFVCDLVAKTYLENYRKPAERATVPTMANPGRQY
jgi:small subunit ribosomal protein S2